MVLGGSAIFAAGHIDRDGNSVTDLREQALETGNVATVDPETLDLKRVFVPPAMDGFVSSTTVIRIGTVAGSCHGDRPAYVPVPE